MTKRRESANDREKSQGRDNATETQGSDGVNLTGQKRALELAIHGGRLCEVLDVLTVSAERQSQDGLMASILLVSPGCDGLSNGSSPHLPPEFIQAITSQKFGPDAGCFGMAAFGKTEVVVHDIAQDPLWKSYKDLALRHHLAACWSIPILSSTNQPLAIFTGYYRQPRVPSENDRSTVGLLSRTAGFIMEWFSEVAQRKEAQRSMKKSNQHLRALIATATDVVYRMSPDWKKMWTLDGKLFLPNTMDVIDDWRGKYLLPEDLPTIDAAIKKAIHEKNIFHLEHRIIQTDGTIGWTQSRAIPILDEAGNISEWYGLAMNVTHRKSYETSLADTVSLLESILKNAPVGYALLNKKYEYLYVNEALAKINHFASESHIGRNVMDILPAFSADLIKILDTVFQTAKVVQNVEIKGEPAATPGVEQSWLATFYPVMGDNSSEVKYVGAAVLEITDRVRAEQSLKESEKQFRDFSNSIQNLAWMAHGDGWIYWYNQRWYDYTGTTLEDMQGWGWTAVHHPVHVQRITEFVNKAWQSGERFEVTFPLRGKDGQYRWFLTRVSPVKDEQGRVIRWIGTNTDIHEKLRIQEELKESENRLRQISDFMPQIVWATDPLGYHEFFNKRWYEFTGLTFDETKGEGWMKVLHPADIARTWEIWNRSINSGGTYEVEYRMKRFDGEYRWLLARAMPLRRMDGTIERWFGTCTDIHDQKTMADHMEALVQERTKELKRSNDDLQQFAHVASHDLKEPVRKIQLFANIIAERFGDSLPPTVNVNIQKIQKSANRTASMIDGILLYSSLDGSMMVMEDVNINTIINEVESELELIINAKDAKITYQNMPVIKGAPTLIYQLFYNLISNALKFSDPRRQLLLNIRCDVVEKNGGPFYEIVLEDNGIGFKDIYAETIFSTFTRLHSKDKFEGTGLGLSLCKKIVERHGGSITATAKEDFGAKFTVRLPVAV